MTRIQREIACCDVALVLIGREWLAPADGDAQARIFDELDWVHLEKRAALERDVPVVPILVEGVRMPRPHQLPEAVRPLSFRNGMGLSTSSWGLTSPGWWRHCRRIVMMLRIEDPRRGCRGSGT